MAESVYIPMSETPQQILAVMDGLLTRHEAQQEKLQRYQEELEAYAKPVRRYFWAVWLLALLGFGFLAVESFMGYSGNVLGLLGMLLIMAGLYVSKAVAVAVKPGKRKKFWIPWAAMVVGLIGIPAIMLPGAETSIEGVVLFAIFVAIVLIHRHYHSFRIGSINADMFGVSTLDVSDHFYTSRDVIYTLRDDVGGRGRMIGHLDLTDPERQQYLINETMNSRHLTVKHYHKDWLKLKVLLYDGNMLRLSVGDRLKVRQSYKKRSASGKIKTKPPKYKQEQRLHIRLTVNPEVYSIASFRREQVKIGQYRLLNIDIDEGGITLKAEAPDTIITPKDILNVLQFIYGKLQLRREALS